MKAIFVAAGEGSRMEKLTKDTPKPLIKVNGKSILERQISLLQKFGINEIIIITGPFSDKYNFENVEYITDENFKDHDQLGSLATAIKKIQNDVLIIFADILFDESILKIILENTSDIVIAVDMNWDKYQNRDNNPIEEADKVTISDGKIKRIFKHKKEVDKKSDIGEFIGLMRLNQNGSENIKKIFSEIKQRENEKFHDAESFKKAKLIDFLQEVIEHGIKISPEIIDGKWCEIDTLEDLEIAKKIFTN